MSDHCFYRTVRDAGTLPRVISQALLDSSRTGHFPYSSNSEIGVSIPLKTERKQKKPPQQTEKEKKKIMHHFLRNK